jgi:hypothetical protein
MEAQGTTSSKTSSATTAGPTGLSWSTVAGCPTKRWQPPTRLSTATSSQQCSTSAAGSHCTPACSSAASSPGTSVTPRRPPQTRCSGGRRTWRLPGTRCSAARSTRTPSLSESARDAPTASIAPAYYQLIASNDVRLGTGDNPRRREIRLLPGFHSLHVRTMCQGFGLGTSTPCRADAPCCAGHRPRAVPAEPSY